MKSNEEILRSSIGLLPFIHHFSAEEPTRSVYKAMDEYAKEYVCGFLMKWCKLTEKEAMDLIDAYHSEDVKTPA
jgi:hypothetical protein